MEVLWNFDNAKMTDYLVPVCLALVVAYLVKAMIFRWTHKLPPGPWGIPFWGYTPFLSKDTYKDYWELHKKYGPVFGYWQGGQYIVVLGNLPSIREAFGKDEFSFRPEGVMKLIPNCDNVAHMSGSLWKESRRFTMVAFKNLGRDVRMEDRVKEEISLDFETLGQGKEVNLYDFFRRSLVNTFLSMISGTTYQDGEPELKLIHKYFNSLNDNLDLAIDKFFSPNFGLFNGIKKPFTPAPTSEGLKEGERLFWSEIEEWERRTNMDIRDNYLDHYGFEMKRYEGKESSFSRENMMGNALMLVMTGGDTVKSKLVWLFLSLAKYPDKQEKLYQQIVEVLGKERVPSWTDRDDLPYATAFVMEVTRTKTITPAIDHHRAGYAGTVNGYYIPKDTILSSNIHAVHYDQKLWGDPEAFRPERFLSNEGKVVQLEGWIPFLIGRRSCPAEKMSMMQLFLITTWFVQKYQILPPEGGLSLEGSESSTLTAQKPYVYFKRRN